MFMGQYNHTVDAKGRLSIPSKFREQLGDEFVVTKGMDGCLFVYDNENWSELQKKLMSLPTLTNKDARFLNRYFLSGAMQVEVDKQGRILLPPTLRTSAGLERDVVLAGVGDRIEIWDQNKWENLETDMDMDEIAATMERLGLSI